MMVIKECIRACVFIDDGKSRGAASFLGKLSDSLLFENVLSLSKGPTRRSFG
jgi:hypothetical protein